MSVIETLTQTPVIKHTEPAVDVNADEFEKVVRSRRSVRAYTDDPIPENVMRRCLDLTLLAPNSSNLQPWEFYWVRDPEKKKELARLCLGQPAATTAQELIVCVARLDTWRRNRQLLLDDHEATKEGLPEAMEIYYKKIVPWAYGQGPFYLLGPIKKLVGSIIALTRPLPRGPLTAVTDWPEPIRDLHASLDASGADTSSFSVYLLYGQPGQVLSTVVCRIDIDDAGWGTIAAKLALQPIPTADGIALYSDIAASSDSSWWPATNSTSDYFASARLPAGDEADLYYAARSEAETAMVVQGRATWFLRWAFGTPLSFVQASLWW